MLYKVSLLMISLSFVVCHQGSAKEKVSPYKSAQTNWLSEARIGAFMQSSWRHNKF